MLDLDYFKMKITSLILKEVFVEILKKSLDPIARKFLKDKLLQFGYYFLKSLDRVTNSQHFFFTIVVII